MESIFVAFADRAGLLVEGAAVLIVVFGSAEAFARLVWTVWARTATHGQRKEIWRRFGVWLLLGLELELAADIIGSVISPTWKDIGELAAIAAIRTFLNYFLEKDLERAEAIGESETPHRIAPVTR
jgi:uncharacterized membrane protein